MIKTNFFLSCLEISVGVERDVEKSVTVAVGLEITFRSKALKTVPPYLITNDTFLIIAKSSPFMFLSSAFLIVKTTFTEPQITSRTMTSDVESCSRWASVAIKLSLKDSLFAITLQFPLNFTINVSVNIGDVVLSFDEENSRDLEEAVVERLLNVSPEEDNFVPLEVINKCCFVL